MVKAIRVVVTKTYTYVPDLTEETYKVEGCASLEDALALDRREVESGQIGMEEIGAKDPIETYSWSIIDE